MGAKMIKKNTFQLNPINTPWMGGALGPEKNGCVRLDLRTGPLPPSIHNSLKKTSPSICSMA